MQKGSLKCLTLLFAVSLFLSSTYGFQIIQLNTNTDSNSFQSSQISMLIQQTCEQITGQSQFPSLKAPPNSPLSSESVIEVMNETAPLREPAQALISDEQRAFQLSTELIRDHLRVKAEVISMVRKELAEQNLLHRQTSQKVRVCATEIFGSDRELAGEVKSCVKAALIENLQNPDLLECSAQTIDIESIALMFRECLDI